MLFCQLQLQIRAFPWHADEERYDGGDDEKAHKVSEIIETNTSIAYVEVTLVQCHVIVIAPCFAPVFKVRFARIYASASSSTTW